MSCVGRKTPAILTCSVINVFWSSVIIAQISEYLKIYIRVNYMRLNCPNLTSHDPGSVVIPAIIMFVRVFIALIGQFIPLRCYSLSLQLVLVAFSGRKRAHPFSLKCTLYFLVFVSNDSIFGCL